MILSWGPSDRAVGQLKKRVAYPTLGSCKFKITGEEGDTFISPIRTHYH